MSTEDIKNKNVSLTAEDLKNIIAGAVSEAVKAAKAPNAIEQAKLDQQQKQIEQDQQTRLETSEQIKQDMANKAFRKQTCQHEGGKPKHPHTVFVSDDLGGYVLCQVCNAVIRPESQLVHFPKDIQQKRQDIIFNTALFNKVFQSTDASGMFA
jgi:hypothetical protein